MQNTHMLVIDPQEDFCNPQGALFVPGADSDMERLATFVNRVGDKIRQIHCTLDQHNLFDVAHPIAWVDSSGNHPTPFTIIDDQGLSNWKASKPGLQKRFEIYVDELKSLGRNPLCIWPPHCLIGSSGSNVVESLFEAFNNWCLSKRLTINWVAKGSNPLTEHYSAIVADVPDANDPGTQLNVNLIQLTETADTILLAGEAGSHCLKWTVTDIANNFNESSIKKFVLLTDATSPVPGFESHYEQFVNDLTARGMQVATTTDWMN